MGAPGLCVTWCLAIGCVMMMVSASTSVLAEEDLVLLHPLHRQVLPVGEKISIRAAIFGVEVALSSGHWLQLFMSPGSQDQSYPIDQLCPLQQYPSGRCDVTFQLELPHGSYILAMRIRDKDQTVGKVSEITFRVQAPFEGSWNEGTCWSGFLQGPIARRSCLWHPSVDSPWMSEHPSLLHVIEWMFDMRVNKGRMSIAVEEFKSHTLANPLTAARGLLREPLPHLCPLTSFWPLATPRGSVPETSLATLPRHCLQHLGLVSEALLHFALGKYFSHYSWYPVDHEAMPFNFMDPPCIGEPWTEVRESSLTAPPTSSRGSGPTALILAAESSTEEWLATVARRGVGEGFDWFGDGGEVPPSLNDTARNRVGLRKTWIAAWAQDVAMAASVLQRTTRRFTVHPLPTSPHKDLSVDFHDIFNAVSGKAETACFLSRKFVNHWETDEDQVRRLRPTAASVKWSCMYVRDIPRLQHSPPGFTLHSPREHNLGITESAGLAYPPRWHGDVARYAVPLLSPRAREEGRQQAHQVRYVMPVLHGLLGNVLFQVAASLSFAWELDDVAYQGSRWKVLIPSPRDPKQCGKTFLPSLLSHPSVHRRVLSEVSITSWHYAEEGPCFICHYPILHPGEDVRPGGSILVKGWRQSHMYFERHRSRLLRAFSLPQHLEELANARYRQLLSHALGAGHDDFDQVETVSVHVRRGDLLAENGTLLDPGYYHRAISRVGKNKLFLVFSDDIEWCKTSGLFEGLDMVAFVALGLDFIELRVISMCDHHIIANSTFSFWAAYLHKTPRWRRTCRRKKKNKFKSRSQVFCPARWNRGHGKAEDFGEGQIYPPDWIRL